MIRLTAGPASAGVEAAAGGRVASLAVNGFELLAGTPADGPIGWGAYPMVPWAGRLGGGRFRFEGHDYRLPCDADDGRHAIHGTGYRSPWQAGEPHNGAVELHVALDWPLGGHAHQRIQLHADRLTCELSATAGEDAMPAVIGWHPWFVRPRHAELAFARMYERGADHLPTGRIVAPGDGPRDDCFLDPLGPLRLHYDELTVTVGSDCDHFVVFDHVAEAICVEPQSAPPDAYNLGLAARLGPGETLRRAMVISWARRSARTAQ